MRVRSLLWLMAMVAFLLPPLAGPVAASDRMAHRVMTDCDHAPPPPCPEKNTAKHAAGLCCALMSGAIALLPAVPAGSTERMPHLFAMAAARHLIGLSPHKDPPPPRV
jgi:hypothetical protein